VNQIVKDLDLPSGYKPLISPWIADRILLILCGGILCGILAFGLSPFTAHPPNEVSWTDNSNGLRFGEYASIMSSVPVRWGGPSDGPCSIEFWTQPAIIGDVNTMLAFDNPSAQVRFTLRQSLDDLALEWQSSNQPRSKPRLLYIAHAFHQDKSSFVTLTSSTGGTSIYLNGELVRSYSEFKFTRLDLSGRIVVGNSPWANDSWSGVLRGVGLYARALTAQDVRKNYAEWVEHGGPTAIAEEEATAVFRFDERMGNVAHNQVPGGIELYIPDHYLVLHPPLLEALWEPRDWWSWGFWKDTLINIGGFIPLGFFFCLYFSRSRSLKRAILSTIMFGCAVSLFIEATQYYLPTRDSDSMDWLNNTLGTAFGAVSYKPAIVQKLIARFGLAAPEAR